VNAAVQRFPAKGNKVRNGAFDLSQPGTAVPTGGQMQLNLRGVLLLKLAVRKQE